MMNYLNREGIKHSSERIAELPKETKHIVLVEDALDLLAEIPPESIDLVVCDPPYNLDIASWDTFVNYLDWASCWIEEIPRILEKSGNFVLFGGMQFQDEKGGGGAGDFVSHIFDNQSITYPRLCVNHSRVSVY